MHRRLGVLGIAAGLAGASACTLLTDLSGLSGSASDAGTSDAAVRDVTDAPAEDAAGDASTPAEGGGGTDAGADAEAGPFCQSLSPQPVFCADFDEKPVDFGWSNLIVNAPGTVTADGADFRSAPKSLLVTLPATSSSQENGLKRASGSPTDMTLAFDLELVQIPSGGALDIIGFDFPSSRGIYLHVTATSAGLAQQIPTDAGPQYPGFPLSQHFYVGQWSRVQIDVHLAPAPPTATVWMDGTKVLDAATLDPAQVPAPVTIGVGLQWVTVTSSPWSMRFDNVVFDAK